MSRVLSALKNDPRLNRVRPLARRLRQISHSLGMEFSALRTEDRLVLESRILPALAEDETVHSILFVGSAWYTDKYEKVFAGKNYWTIEIDPTLRRYGSRQHVTDSVANIRSHFSPETFDLIICNGVWGWGLDEKDEVEKAFSGCHDCLKPEGVLLLGWNDVEAHRPQPLDTYHWFASFRPYVFQPLGTDRFETGTDNRHVYSFFIKGPRADDAT